MAYDRYDSRDQNRGYRDDRQRDHRSGQRDERGFFDRAIDSVSSFFSDDDDDRSRQRQRGSENRYSSATGYDPQAYDQDRDRQRRGREDDRFGHSDRSGMFGGGQSTSYGRGRDEGDYRNQYGRGGGESGGFGGGNYGRQGQDYYSRQGQDYGDLGGDRSYPSSYGHSGGGSYRDDDRQGRGFQSQGGDRYRPMTGDYGRGSNDQGHQGSGMGGQAFGREQYGRQDFSQDQDRDRDRQYNYGGWGDQDSRRQSQGQDQGRWSGGGYGQDRDRQDRGSSGFMGGSSSSSSRSPHDDHYQSWRQRQIEELDRDYDEYRREHQSRFENEFTGFRQQRQTKRQMLNSIREHMEVVDENGEHVGTVDKVRGDKIIMTKNDPEAGGVHRSFTCSLLERVEDDKVHLSGSKDSIRSRLTEEREDDQNRGQSSGGIRGALFGSEGNDRDDRNSASSRATTMSSTEGAGQGPHVLDRSFPGTYDDDNKR